MIRSKKKRVFLNGWQRIAVKSTIYGFCQTATVTDSRFLSDPQGKSMNRFLQLSKRIFLQKWWVHSKWSGAEIELRKFATNLRMTRERRAIIRTTRSVSWSRETEGENWRAALPSWVEGGGPVQGAARPVQSVHRPWRPPAPGPVSNDSSSRHHGKRWVAGSREKCLAFGRIYPDSIRKGVKKNLESVIMIIPGRGGRVRRWWSHPLRFFFPLLQT